MNSKLRNMLAPGAVFFFTALGIGAYVSTPQPAGRTMLELKDAGVLDGQRTVLKCPERLTKQTIRRINVKQPGLLRPKQAYGIVARSARCFGDVYLDGGFGNCLRPSDGGSLAPYITERLEFRYPDSTDGGNLWLRTAGEDVSLNDGGALAADRRNDGGYFTRIGSDPKDPEIIVPSLRANLAGIDLDASVGSDDGGDNDDVDDAFQYATSSCSLLTCTQFDDGVTAGTYASPYANGCLGGLNRLALQPMPCMLPDPFKFSPDGGWYEGTPVDCKGIGPYGESDGGPRWRGFNVTPREYAVGADCLPSACVIVSGDPLEWL